MKSLLQVFIILTTSLAVIAQNESYYNDLKEIITSEKHTYQALENHKEHINQKSDFYYHKIHWKVNPAIHFIEGKVTTYFIASKDSTTSIYFDFSSNMEILEAYNTEEKLEFEFISDSRLEIKLNKSLQKGDKDSLTLIYQGIPYKDSYSFVTTTHSNRPLLWTLSEPYGSKAWWPCHETLNDKIDSLDIYITTPRQYKVASNGLLKSSNTTTEDTMNTTHHWCHRYPIASYLVSMTVYEYEEFIDFAKTPSGDSIPILNYVFPESLKNARSQLKHTVDIMEFFNDKFGLYPFSDEKYGHAQFGWGGGMEHQTMSSMGGFGYVLQAHELAHQWFGNKVTCGSWQDIWLNEGFATYLTGLCFEFITPDETDWSSFLTNTIKNVTSQPNGSVWVPDTSSVNRIFSSRLSYDKGAMLLHMLRWTLGDEDFFQGIRNYLNDEKLSFGYAKTDDLKRHLEIQSGLNLNSFFEDWFFGEGYPKYTINVTYQNQYTELQIFQESSHESVPFFEMPIPIQFKSSEKDTIIRVNHISNGQKFQLELDFKPDTVIFDPHHWILTPISTTEIITSVNNISLLTPELNIYPMPTKKTLNIELNHSNDNLENSIYEIFNMQGQSIQKGKIFNKTIDLQSLNPGIYLININNSKYKFTKKIEIIK